MSEIERYSNDKAHMRLIEIAIEKGVDIVQLEKLMDLHERHEAAKAKKAFHLAMSKFQSLLPTIEKQGVVDYKSPKGRTYYDYAKIEDIAKAIRPALKEAGLSYRFSQSQEKGWITVTCVITHCEGHSEISVLSSQPDISGGKDQLKATASAITYLRRYTLTGALGVVVGGEDDDGGAVINQNESDCYPEEKFIENYPNWERAILAGKKTPEEILRSGAEQGIKLTQEQIKKIKSAGEPKK